MQARKLSLTVLLELSVIMYGLPCSNHGDMTNSWEYSNEYTSNVIGVQPFITFWNF